MNIQILDCTLRDGGYVNEWHFQNEHIRGIINSLVSSNIDIIEAGFLSHLNGQKKDSTKYRSLDDAERVLATTTLKGGKRECVLMGNYGEIDTALLPKRNSENIITGLRLAFHQKDWRETLKVAQKIVDKGYDLYAQPMITMGYSDMDLISLINSYNKIGAKAFYIVDSFGYMEKKDLQRLFFIVDNNLNKNIQIGFHSHNNMQLSFSNSVLLLEECDNRNIIIDSSIYGMGRGAGNLNTEIFARYLNKHCGANYNTICLLDIIDNYLEAVYKESYWGYSVAHFLSASAECHPNIATYLVNKKTLPVTAIRKILGCIKPNEKIRFTKKYIDELYLQYQSEVRAKLKEFEFQFKNKKSFTNCVWFFCI